MELQYYIDETVDHKKTTYVPVTVKLFAAGEKEFENKGYPWEYVWFNRVIRKGTPVYLVSYIQHSGHDSDNRLFFSEADARKYIEALGKAVELKDKPDMVEVHYGFGLRPLKSLLSNLPMNTYVNFRTPTQEYSVTLSKTIF